MGMKITFVKRGDNKNAVGVRIELDPMTEAEVKVMRASCAKVGWKEGRNTRKLSDAELSQRTQVQPERKLRMQ
jgi:predicted 2-oxoglutarate/Fe(II)-dependent dioxygenase YbiX